MGSHLRPGPPTGRVTGLSLPTAISLQLRFLRRWAACSKGPLQAHYRNRDPHPDHCESKQGVHRTPPSSTRCAYIRRHSQIQPGSTDSRTEYTHTTGSVVLYRPNPSTVLLQPASQIACRVRGDYAAGCISKQTHSLTFDLVFLY